MRNNNEGFKYIRNDICLRQKWAMTNCLNVCVAGT